MSKTLSLQLSNKSAKPVFTTKTPTDRQIKCMLDTGADMPVWCRSEGLLKIVFPKVKLIDKKFLLSGFGRKPEMVGVIIVGGVPLFFALLMPLKRWRLGQNYTITQNPYTNTETACIITETG